MVEVADSEDPEGLRVFYYLVQDLKVRGVLVFVRTVEIFNVATVFDLLPHLPPLQDQAHIIVLSVLRRRGENHGHTQCACDVLLRLTVECMVVLGM